MVAALAVLLSSACADRPRPPPTIAAASGSPPLRPSPRVSAEAPSGSAVATDAASAVPPSASAAPAEEAAPEAVPVKVPGDKRVFVLPGVAGATRVLVYLHGRCGDPLAFLAWATVARRLGTTVSFDGDEKCDGGRTKWSPDTVGLDKRITRALDAVEAALGLSLTKERRLVIGYSAGALRAEALATRFADRYPRVILIGGPRAPRPESLGKTEAILLMAGQLDVRKPLMDAASDLTKAGRHARFIMIPHARHGEYGPEAIETMQEALSWVTDGDGPETTTHAEASRLSR